MNDRFIKKISINWNEIEEDTYLREIPALQFEEFLTFDRNVTFFAGENGSGKSTLLRCATLLTKMDSGDLLYSGDYAAKNNEQGVSVYADKQQLKKIRSRFGLVFQNFNLFPHYSVLKNLTDAPIHVLGRSKEEATEKAIALLEKMGLADKADAYPCQLSGGQQQRVAIARAIVSEPRLLLLDEPLSNLDAKLRESMRDELRALQKRLGITSLYVTHDQSEAMAISDRVVIMKDGVICQQGTPTEIYEQPNSRFVANFIGKANFIDGTFRGMDGENALVEVGGHTFPIPAPGKMEGVQKDGPCCLTVRPESVLLSEEEGPLPGVISRATYYGAKVEYEVMLGDQPIIVEVYNPQLSKRFAEGEAVHMTLIDRCVRVLA